MKKLAALLFLLPSLALAQRGGPARVTLTTINSCIGVVQHASCVGYGRVTCVDDATNIAYRCSPDTLTWKQISSGNSGGGGGGNADFGDISSGTSLGQVFVVGQGSTLTFSGNGSVVANQVACTNCVALSTETTGSYAASNAEAGDAIGVSCTSSCITPLTEIVATTSSDWIQLVSDETGTGSWVFGTSPTISTPTINGFTGNRCARFNASGVLVASSTGDCDSGDTGGGGGDGIRIGGSDVTDGTGVDFTGGVGIDISYSAVPTPDTADFVLDATEVGDLVWGDGSDSSVVQQVNVPTGTDPAWTYTASNVGLNVPLDVADQITAPGNYDGIRDNDVNLTPDPTCANSGSAGEGHFLDSDESATDVWDFCDGTSLKWRFPATSTTTTQFLAATSTAGAGAYRAIVAGDLPAVSNNVTFTMNGIATGDIGVARIPSASTITRFNCWVVGTSSPSVATVTLNVRASATPTTGTANNVVTAATTNCDTTTINTSVTLTTTAITAGQWLYLTFGTVTGTTNLVVSVDYTTP